MQQFKYGVIKPKSYPTEEEFEYMISHKFGHWTIIRKESDYRINGIVRKEMQLLCECDCPDHTRRTISAYTLLKGATKSCGCAHRLSTYWSDNEDTTNSKLYAVLANMKYRCNNQSCRAYHNYGGKGIKVCKEWSDGSRGFENFYRWAMKNGYKEGLTIDRIDAEDDYKPSNCRWISKGENTARANRDSKKQHRKSNKGDYYAVNEDTGETIIFSNANKFGREHGIKPGTIRYKADHIENNTYINGWRFGHTNELGDAI